MLSWPGRVDQVKCVGFSVLLDRNLKFKGWSITVKDGLLFSQLGKKIQKTIRAVT